MTKFLKDQGVKPIGENFEMEKIYALNHSKYEELTHNFSPVSFPSGAAGQNCTIRYVHNPDDKYRVSGLYAQWLATNNDASNTVKFFNPFLTLERCVCIVNGTKVDWLDNQVKLMCAVSEDLKPHTRGERFAHMQTFRTETGETLVGESVAAAGGTKYFSLNLFVLFPWLKDYIPNFPIQVLEFQLFFTTNTASVANGLFCVSDTTNNAYGTSLVYSNIQLKMCCTKIQDPRLFKHTSSLRLLVPQWDIKTYNAQSWTTVGTDQVSIDLNSVFNLKNRILGVSCFVISPAMITAYNDADSCLYRSSPTYIGWKLITRSKTVVDMTTSAKLHERRRYCNETTKNRHGHYPPFEVIDDSTNMSRIYYLASYVDLVNLQVENADEYPVSDYNNNSKVDEVVFTCESSINASCNVYVCLHYMNFLVVKNGKSNPMTLELINE